jgi:hypothetical protein
VISMVGRFPCLLTHPPAQRAETIQSVTAAGICIDKPFEEHTWDDLQKQFLVNVCLLS